jgi:single-stranded-DNA-specific exonuclease
LRRHLDLVALGTIADIAPLLDENRILVRYGLQELTHSPKRGVQALKQVGKIPGQDVGPRQVGFTLAPRLNAAGRLAGAKAGVELLLTEDPVQAEQLASYLDQVNRERQVLQAQIYQEAKAALDTEGDLAAPGGIVLASERWHPGVVGIVASKLVEEYRRPTVLIGLEGEVGKGSGRSIAAFHLYHALVACQEHLTGFGGHEHAAGLRIERHKIAAFRDAFNHVVSERLTAADCLQTLTIDAEVALADIDAAFMAVLTRLEPFGEGNPPPVLMARGVGVVGNPTLVGKNRQHLQLTVRQGSTVRRAIGFNLGEKVAEARQGVFDIAFTPQRHLWNDVEEWQLILQDLRPHVG